MDGARGAARLRPVVSVVVASWFATAAAAEPVDFEVTTTDGHAVRLADFRGRWLLVNYWATWRGDCVAEMPALSRFVERDARIAVLGLTDEAIAIASLRTFVAAHPVSYAIASIDRANPPVAVRTTLAPTAFGIAVRPISYLIAPDGMVVERIVGVVDVAKIARRIDERQ